MDLVVRVRAAGDSSLTAVFRPLLAASAAAAKAIEANLAGAGKGAVKAAKEGAAAVKAAADAQAISIAGIQALRDKDHARFLSQIKAEEAEQKKAAAATGRAHEKAYAQASAAARTFGSIMRTGVGTAKEVGAGFGVDFSLQGGLARGMQRNSTAIALSNAAYKDGGPGENGFRADKRTAARPLPDRQARIDPRRWGRRQTSPQSTFPLMPSPPGPSPAPQAAPGSCIGPSAWISSPVQMDRPRGVRHCFVSHAGGKESPLPTRQETMAWWSVVGCEGGQFAAHRRSENGGLPCFPEPRAANAQA